MGRFVWWSIIYNQFPNGEVENNFRTFALRLQLRYGGSDEMKQMDFFVNGFCPIGF